jgi:hypothetical protein
MKNRKRETCTSGTVRDEDGNILIYSAHSKPGPRHDPTRPYLPSWFLTGRKRRLMPPDEPIRYPDGVLAYLPADVLLR